MSRSLLLCAALVILPPSAQARPVSYPDGWMIMQMNDHMENSLMASYSPTAKDAVGVRTDYMREDEHWLHTVTYNRLLKRWNAEHSQGNLFLQSGAGFAEDHGDKDAAATAGIEADWETRRIYFSYENRFIYAGDIEQSFSHKARAGFAPYAGSYDDLHTWLMVQVDHHPQERDNVVITPFVRLFNTDALAELGISNKRDILFNLTLQF